MRLLSDTINYFNKHITQSERKNSGEIGHRIYTDNNKEICLLEMSTRQESFIYKTFLINCVYMFLVIIKKSKSFVRSGHHFFLHRKTI